MTRICSTGCGNRCLAKGLCRKCYDAQSERVAARRMNLVQYGEYYRQYRQRMTAEQKEKVRVRAREYARRKYGHRPMHLIGPSPLSKTGYRGVRFVPTSGRFNASIRVEGRRHWLGSFRTKEEAARAYNAAVDRFFPDTPHYKNPVPGTH